MAIDISPQWRQWVQEILPELVEGVSFEFTSNVDFNYNCLSWSLSVHQVLWDDVHGGFWPWSNISPETADGWVQVCQIHGFTLTDTLDADFVPGYEKIAIFEDDEDDLHACRQNQNGRWKSKLGVMGPDIDHDGLTVLEAAYGSVVRILRRKRDDLENLENT